MKKTIFSVWAIGTLLALAACGGSGSAPEYVSDNFLGDVGEAMYNMYNLREQYNDIQTEVIEAWEKGKDADVDNDKVRKLAAEYEQAIRHFQEVQETAVGKTVATELTGDEGVFTLIEPFTVTKIRLKYENEPLINSQTEVQLTMVAKLKLADGVKGNIRTVSVLDEQDSVIYEREATVIYDNADYSVNLQLEDYFGKQYNEGGDEHKRFNSFILKAKKVVILVANATVKDEVRGELGIFDLQGPVKKCTIKNEWGNVVRTFDEDGFWLTHDGQSLKKVYPYGITRDKEGRIIAGKTDADGNGDDYTYNEMGKVTKYFAHYFDDLSTETTTYDKDGNIVKRHFESGGLDMIEPYDETYQNIDVDEHGNWTKRKVTSSDGSTTTQTRVIEYY